MDSSQDGAAIAALLRELSDDMAARATQAPVPAASLGTDLLLSKVG